jgi:hypothetical protein
MRSSIETAPACVWCGRPFPTRRGGSRQTFCCSRHRHAFHSAARRWAERAVVVGTLTVDHIRNGDPAACTLLPRGNSPASVSQLRKAALVAPAARPGESAELLCALLAVQSDGWHALAEAMSDELFDRLKRWHAPRLAKNPP